MAAPRIRFDRHELSGAFGDIGTDLPLLVALIATCHLDPASVCTVFGLLQIATGLAYGIPMPIQPLKAMATLMLAQHFSAGVYAGGGVVIGAAMLLLSLTGALDWLSRVVPLHVIRGIQCGLGVSLATIALRDLVASDGAPGYALAAVSVALLLALGRQRRVPAPLIVIALGALYGLASHTPHGLSNPFGFRLPTFQTPSASDLSKGALLLALPQIPLSLGNSVMATSQCSRDLFPERAVSVRRIGFTYGLMNLVGPLFGGIPVCHGCGGMVGFHGFGARTGGAPVIYGALFALVGLTLSPGFSSFVRLFPKPVLGVVLLFEAVAILGLVRDVAHDRAKFWIALAVAAAVIAMAPYGYLIGLVGGVLVSIAHDRGWIRVPGSAEEAVSSRAP